MKRREFFRKIIVGLTGVAVFPVVKQASMCAIWKTASVGPTLQGPPVRIIYMDEVDPFPHETLQGLNEDYHDYNWRWNTQRGIT